MLDVKTGDKNPCYIELLKTKAPRPIPSESSNVGDKLDSFSKLLGLKSSLYRVIADRWLLCDEKNEKLGDADLIIHLDLLAILQILQEVTEQEYKKMKINLLEALESQKII